MTYRETADTIGRFQAVLTAQGLRRGACVAILSGNRPETWCATIAAQALGMRTTPLHPMGSVDDHRFQLDDSGADAIVVDPVAYQARGGELAGDVGTALTFGPADFGLDLVAAGEAHGAATAVADDHLDDIAIINYTGGTTGRPKGAMRRHPSSVASTIAILADFELPDRPRYLAAAPISHVAGSKIMPVLLRGGSVHLMSGFDPQKFAARVAAEQINMTLAVPTMVYALLDQPDDVVRQLDPLELLLYGASPMSPSRLEEGLARIGPVFSQLYGQTECYPVAVLPRADHDPARPELFSACGYPVASCEVELLDDDGQPVPDGEAGEICVRGPHTMGEYWKRPEQTAEAFAGGWLHTSDIARRDETGRLFIVDRKKDMIISGGFNVYPKEVEDVLSSHPAVAMVAVIGVPDPKWGEAVTAFIVARPGAAATEDELIALVKRSKGGPHTPKHVEFVESLPLTAVGKIDKKVLREPYWSDTGRQVG